MGTVASIDAAVRANTSNFEAGMRRASKSANSFGETLRNVNKSIQFLRGGGALIGTKLFVNTIANVADEAAKLSAEFRSGEISAQGMVRELAKAVPILNDIHRINKAIHEIITGEEAQSVRQGAAFSTGVKSVNFQNDLFRREQVAFAGNELDRALAEVRVKYEEEIEQAKKIINNKSDLALALKRLERLYVKESQAVSSRIFAEADKRRAEMNERLRSKTIDSFIPNLVQDMARFRADQDATEAERVIAGLQESVQKQEDFTNAVMAGRAMPTNSPLFAESAEFGSMASFEARQRFIRGTSNEELDVSKRQLRELENINRAVRSLGEREDGFFEAGF